MVVEERTSEITKGLQEVAEYMEANGVFRVQSLQDTIIFHGDDNEGMRVVDLVIDFVEERGLMLFDLQRVWVVLGEIPAEPPFWLITLKSIPDSSPHDVAETTDDAS